MLLAKLFGILVVLVAVVIAGIAAALGVTVIVLSLTRPRPWR